MTKTRAGGLLFLLLCSSISILWGAALERAQPGSMGDFRIVYCATRCLLQHCDPYSQRELEGAYRAGEWGGWELPRDPLQFQFATLHVYPPAAYVYPPTVSIFIAPLAMLSWRFARVLWMILTEASLVLAAFLAWDTGAKFAPILSGCLIGFLLANSEMLFAGGNAAGIAVCLCVVAVWCFLEERCVWAGILCLAVSLAIKPHDAGLVWLYFFLAGGVYRKRALQTLLATAALGLVAILWISHVAPHWLPELRANFLAQSAPGWQMYPGPNSATTGSGPNMIIDLQSAIYVFRNDPRIYNPASYLICGALLLAWAVRTFRSRFSHRGAWFALAAIVPITILVTYHRPYDAKLLLLAVPACAMLWAEGGTTGRLALAVTAAGIVFTADIPLIILLILTKGLHISTAFLSGQILTVVLMRPTPIILLAMGVFYLWVYMRRTEPNIEFTQQVGQ